MTESTLVNFAYEVTFCLIYHVACPSENAGAIAGAVIATVIIIFLAMIVVFIFIYVMW